MMLMSYVLDKSGIQSHKNYYWWWFWIYFIRLKRLLVTEKPFLFHQDRLGEFSIFEVNCDSQFKAIWLVSLLADLSNTVMKDICSLKIRETGLSRKTD